tara:strand:+ start:293 stop:421 length:129 start_codon:yes stop_codon:yes gene_type:complete
MARQLIDISPKKREKLLESLDTETKILILERIAEIKEERSKK